MMLSRKGKEIVKEEWYKEVLHLADKQEQLDLSISERRAIWKKIIDLCKMMCVNLEVFPYFKNEVIFKIKFEITKYSLTLVEYEKLIGLSVRMNRRWWLAKEKKLTHPLDTLESYLNFKELVYTLMWWALQKKKWYPSIWRRHINGLLEAPFFLKKYPCWAMLQKWLNKVYTATSAAEERKAWVRVFGTLKRKINFEGKPVKSKKKRKWFSKKIVQEQPIKGELVPIELLVPKVMIHSCGDDTNVS